MVAKSVDKQSVKKTAVTLVLLGVAMAKMAWDEIWVETENDCYFELRDFMAE